MTQDVKPGIKNVSLALYRQFYDDISARRIFRYSLQDGNVLSVRFDPFGLYHLLGIQHIDSRIKAKTFYSEIDNGLYFPDFRKDKKVKKCFIDMIDRLEMFSCIYYLMKSCRLFFVPSGIVNGTRNVAANYVIHSKIQGEGMTIGLRNDKNNRLIAITILADRKNNAEKHIYTNNENFISKLDIIERASSNIIETVKFSSRNSILLIFGEDYFFPCEMLYTMRANLTHNNIRSDYTG